LNREVSRFAAGAFRVLAEDRLAADGLAEDRLAEDRLAADGLAEDRLAEDRLAADGLAEDRLAEDREAEDRERADPVAFVAFVDVVRDVFFTAGRRAGDVFFFAAVFRVLVVPRAVLFFVAFFAKPTSSTPSCTAGAR
jgi:hypothetical protein